jgi:hypothetical protein
VELRFEEKVCTRHAPAPGDRVHAQRVRIEAAGRERPAALVGIGEHVVARSLGSLDRNRVLGQSGLGDLVLGVALRHPAGEGKPTVRNEDPMRLGERALRLRDVQDPEVHRDRVKRRVGERQPQRIAHHEREVGTAQASPFDHRRRDVHADRLCPACRSRLGDEARPARHVERPRPSAHRRGVEERLDEQHRVGPALLVAGRGALPARALELRECVTAHGRTVRRPMRSEIAHRRLDVVGARRTRLLLRAGKRVRANLPHGQLLLVPSRRLRLGPDTLASHAKPGQERRCWPRQPRSRRSDRDRGDPEARPRAHDRQRLGAKSPTTALAP